MARLSTLPPFHQRLHPAACPPRLDRYIALTQKMYMSRGAVPPSEDSIRAYYWSMRAKMEAAKG